MATSCHATEDIFANSHGVAKNLVFQTAVTAKTISKSSLGQLLVMELDIDVKACLSFSKFARLQLARRLHG